MSAVVCSRRVSAGITPDPGALSTLPVWWSSTDWVEVEVSDAVRVEHRDICREEHVEPDTVVAVARGHAHYADAKTGRDCRPTNARLVEDLKLSLSTVQRARRVLKRLGLVVEVVRGRSVMTLAERLAAHGRGSSHRAIAATFALCSRGRKRRTPSTDLSTSTATAVDRDTPPVGALDRREVTLRRPRLRSETATRKAAPRPAHTEKSRHRPADGPDPRSRRLAQGLKRRLTWLQDEHVQRLAPLLTPFARADWTVDDLDLAAGHSMAARGWRGVPKNLVRPAAYLATLLLGVDPADRPTVLDDAHAAAERAHQRLVTRGAPCEHGVPGGDVVSPLTAQRGCPLCRAAAE